MFLHTRTVKDWAVTLGTMSAQLLFFALAVKAYLLVDGWAAVIFCIPILTIPVMVFFGMNIGYSIAKFFIGMLAILMIGGVCGPFIYGDYLLAHERLSYLVVLPVALLVEAFLFSIFYCLSEHQLIRKQDKNV